MDDNQRYENYKQHRLRIKKATSLVNSHVPKPRPTNAQLRDQTYLEMMKYLATPGKIKQDNFKLFPLMDERNILFFKENPDQETKSVDHKTNKLFPIPFHIRQRYDHFSFAKNSQLMQKLLRPIIYFDLMYNEHQSLGRLVIQLFTEACPEIVLQFVRSCLYKQHNRFHINRILFPLWLEAELLFDDNNALTSNNIEHDATVINHGSSSGILSIPSRYLRGSKYRFITFTLSFTPINVLNGKRIAFGIIRCGQNVLERLQSFEVTRCGKPCKNVAVSACGVL
ncbi:peptidyl-prolyl cis-trans isomerase G [Cochliomyia hominivorax]